MYKLIIVDDEEEVRKGMFYEIDWNALGFDGVAQAENGIEAIALIEQYQPQVILTDIRMEKMDGMELIDHVKISYPEIEIVLVSGYSDIEYYQKALEIKIFGYLL